MKIAVFGKSGQVATELARRSPRSVKATYFGREEAEFMLPDLVRNIALNTDADIIINAAAYTAVDHAETEPVIAQAVNAGSVRALGEAAAEKGIPILHVSTDYVFDGSGDKPWKPDDPTGPLSVYGTTKLAGEVALREIGADHVILRASWVFSAHRWNFVKTMLNLADAKSEISVVNDQIGGPTPAAAIADALFVIARQMLDNRSKAGTYHFAGAPEVSWADFAREIFRIMGRDIKVTEIPTTEFPRPATRPLNSRLDCSSTMATFGIGRPDWKAGLRGVLRELDR